jgi:hypothetical protein
MRERGSPIGFVDEQSCRQIAGIPLDELVELLVQLGTWRR